MFKQNNAKNTKELLNKCKSADVVYLATDPDTEGEGISWHLKELIRGVNKNCEFKRVTFNEITEKHVLESIKNPRTIDQNKVDSHFGRSVSDYLYGFYVSPLLWKVLNSWFICRSSTISSSSFNCRKRARDS